ncbi:hypothetical protein [Streptomyces sp. CB01635]|uniref:hypothetical protein n=1 Tax=Streptomyces sp. CB01635 TaxID=2020326 RepID=UPI00131AD312
MKAAARYAVADGGIAHRGGSTQEPRILGNTGSVEVTIQLPAGSRVEAKSAAAELRGAGGLGDVTFDRAQGPVKI